MKFLDIGTHRELPRMTQALVPGHVDHLAVRSQTQKCLEQHRKFYQKKWREGKENGGTKDFAKNRQASAA